jgi:hypothetical protein
VPQKIKFLNLNELFHFLSAPGEWYDVRREMQRLRRAAGSRIVCEALWDDWCDDNTLTLEDARVQYTLQSEEGVPARRGGGMELINVIVVEHRPDRERRITAERAVLKITGGDTLEDSGVCIELHDAQLSDGTASIARVKTTLDPVAVPAGLIARVEGLSDAALLNPAEIVPDDPLAEKRKRAKKAHAETVRRIIAAINERAAFSVSVFVLLILGAVLGIIFRGAHVMTAFGISFVPMLFVILMIVTGKQMAHNAGTHVLGLLVMWTGIVVVAGLDVWTLARVLRR